MGGDFGKIAALGALGMTGLGLAGVGPMAGLLGGSAAAGTGESLLASDLTGMLGTDMVGPPISLAGAEAFGPPAFLKAPWYEQMFSGASSALSDPKNAMKLGDMGMSMMNKGQQKPQQQMPSLAPVSLGSRGESAPMGAKTYQDALAQYKTNMTQQPKPTAAAFGSQPVSASYMSSNPLGDQDMQGLLSEMMAGQLMGGANLNTAMNNMFKKKYGSNWIPA